MAYVQEKPEEKVEASWNIAMGFVMEIQNCLKLANHCCQRDNIYGAFKSLHNVRMRIVQYLPKEERIKFRLIENRIKKLLGLKNNVQEPENKIKLLNKISWELDNLYQNYNDKLMDTLKTYKLLIPDKELDEGLF